MRIALFADTYLPDVNGVVSSIETLRLALVKAGHEVYVVCPESGINGIVLEDHVLRIPGVKLSFLYGYTLAAPWHRKIWPIVKSWNLDVIHVHTEFGVGQLARNIARQMNIPIVYTYHTFYEDYTHYVNFLHSPMIDKAARKAIRKLSVANTANIQRVIVPTEKTRERLLDYGVRTSMAIVPTGLDLDAFRESKEEVKKFFPEDVFTVVYVGRLAEEKSIDMVMEAMTMLKGEKIGFLVVGDGPDFDKLQKLAHKLELDDEVRFAGKIPHDNISAYYREADVFVSASMSETQGMTFIEAMACGLPVLARDKVALEGVLLDGKNGYYFEDAADLAEKIRKLNVSNNREEMKAESEKVAEKYSLRSFAAMAEEVYLEAIKEKKGGIPD